MDVAQNYKLDLQKPQVLFILGGPGSGIGTQCERLVRDFKFEHISIEDMIKKEIHNQTKDGLRLQPYVEKGNAVPTELSVGLLIQVIKSSISKRFLVDGFPTEFEQALHFEQNLREMEFIINLVVPDDILIERFNKASINPDQQLIDSIHLRLKVYNEQTIPMIKIYSKLGKVASINGVGDNEEIYQKVRQAILPNLIFFYGAPSTGKSQVAQKLCKLTGYKYFHLEEFYKINSCISDIEKINKLMKFFKDTSEKNYIINSFLENKAQAVVFLEHFGKPRNIIYFQSSKDEIEQNIRKYSQLDGEKKLRLDRLKVFLKNRDELIGLFSQYQFYHVINAIDSLDNIATKILDLIKPKVLAALTYNNQELADEYIKKLESEEGFIHLQLDTICEEELLRGSSLGIQISAFIQSGLAVPAKMQIELLRKILFQNPHNKKFILTSFPEKKTDFEVFEQSLFPIDGLLIFMKPNQTISYSAKINPSLYFTSENKTLIINDDDLGVFRAFLTKRTKFGFVVGPSTSGKTTVSKFIAQKFGYTLIEWEPTIAQLKEKLGPPGEPLDDVPLIKLVEYYKKQFATISNEKFVFDGFPPGCETSLQINSFLEIGQPTWILANNLSKVSLWKRFKLKNELDAAQELSPEDDDKMVSFIQTADQNSAVLQDYAREQSDCKLYQLDVNNSLEFTLQAIDYIYQKRVFLARCLLEKPTSEQLENLRLVFINIAAQKNITFVDVENLLAKHEAHISQEFGMRWTDLPIKFPSNYNPSLVVRLIQSYLASNPIDNSDVLLWGYPSADLYLDNRQEENMFPRVSDEIASIEKHLGPIRIVQIMKEGQMSDSIEDPEWELVKPEVKPKPVDGGDAQEQPPEETEENKPKYNIYDWSWTKSDGNPKNIAQVYTQLKQPQSVSKLFDILMQESMEVSDYSYKMIFDHFSQCLEKINEDNNANFFTQILMVKDID